MAGCFVRNLTVGQFPTYVGQAKAERGHGEHEGAGQNGAEKGGGAPTPVRFSSLPNGKFVFLVRKPSHFPHPRTKLFPLLR